MFVAIYQNTLETGLIVGGWDKYEGGSIYGVPLGGTMLQLPFAIGGRLLLSYLSFSLYLCKRYVFSIVMEV
jgi:20S proteasome alpha/beta subunit